MTVDDDQLFLEEQLSRCTVSLMSKFARKPDLEFEESLSKYFTLRGHESSFRVGCDMEDDPLSTIVGITARNDEGEVTAIASFFGLSNGRETLKQTEARATAWATSLFGNRAYTTVNEDEGRIYVHLFLKRVASSDACH